MEIIILALVTLGGAIGGAILRGAWKDHKVCGKIVKVVPEAEDRNSPVEPFMVLVLFKEPEWVVRQKIITLKVDEGQDPR